MRQPGRLGGGLWQRMLEVGYDDLQRDTAAQLEGIANFLELESPLPLPTVKRRSLDRWREELTDAQQANIRAAVERFPLGSEDGSRPAAPAQAPSAAAAR